MLSTQTHSHMTATLSPQFVDAQASFDNWYDNLIDDKQELVDSISDRTYYITDEHEYNEFIQMLEVEYGITTAIDFEDKFEAEFEGYGDNQLAEYASNMIDECGYLDRVPDFLKNHIDWQMVWDCELRYDYSEMQFNENTYLFRNH
jgi:hypothetical protein